MPRRATARHKPAKRQDRREHASKRGYDRKWELYSLRYRKQNPLCVRCLKAGRTTPAECVDHVQPVVDGQNDPLFWDPVNHQGLCWACHTVKTQTEDKGHGRSQARGTAGVDGVLVYGAPCSGKREYVKAQLSPGNLVIDVDALHTALTGMRTYDHEPEILPFAYEARDAVRDKLERDGFDGRVWIIATAPKVAQRKVWRKLCRREQYIEADVNACRERARLERSREWLGYINQWFADFEHG